MDSSSSDRNPVEMLAEEFLERHRRGERPNIDEFMARHPEKAEEILDLFPALLMMENVRPAVGDVTGDVQGGPSLPGRQKIERLGDYRILREVGHGGMGIVYEAEQESLGRHVALKVLLNHSLLDPKQLRRFQLEARAAARLHHTNIVPVYGVGEHEGVHYYIMKFIQGQGLDLVLKELKRLKNLQSGSKKSATAGRTPGNDLSKENAAAATAEALLSGHFAVTAEFGPDQAAAATRAKKTEAAKAREGSEAPRSVVGSRVPTKLREADQTSPSPSPSMSVSTSSIHLPGQSEHSTLSHRSNQYFHSVARIGMQVADALGYAHGQGVLHRDIKPSNLLLDTQGTVWVADFGLAKAAADQEDLTHTGDIVGTLRYMAPERFRGKADITSDLYSLGLTIYEMLTLRPAFGGGRSQQTHAAGDERGPAAAAQAEPGRATRSGNHRPQSHCPRAGPSLPDAGGPDRRPEAVCRGSADPGPAGERGRTAVALVPAQSRRGESGGSHAGRAGGIAAGGHSSLRADQSCAQRQGKGIE